MLFVLVAAACAPTPYDRYRAAHPHWVASLVPPPGAALDEVIATLRNPALVVGRIEVVDVAGPRWRRLDVEAIESGSIAAPSGSVLVASSSSCVVSPGDAIRYRAFHWHLLVDGALVAAEETLFDGRCFEDLHREGAELPESYVACLRRFASDQVRRPVEAPDGCGPPPPFVPLPHGKAEIGRPRSSSTRSILLQPLHGARQQSLGEVVDEVGVVVSIGAFRVHHQGKVERVQAGSSSSSGVKAALP